jgi:hypothetical protein
MGSLRSPTASTNVAQVRQTKFQWRCSRRATEPIEGTQAAACVALPSLGIIYAAQGKWLSAQERFRDAFALDGSDTAIHNAYGLHLLGTVGYLRRSLESFLEAHRLAPAWVGPIMTVAILYMFEDQPDSAHKFADLGIDLGMARTAPPMPDLFATLAMREGRYDEAAEIVVAGLPPGIAAGEGAGTIRQLIRALRDRTPAGAQIVALDALRARTAPADMTQIMQRRFMLWYTLLGALDQAFEVATASLDHFAESGTIGVAWPFLWMREMLRFRQDPRFQSMCRRMNLFDYWNKYGAPDNCELRAGKLICRE